MLSYLQYRRIGQNVQRQIERDQEKAKALSLHTHNRSRTPDEIDEEKRNEAPLEPTETTENGVAFQDSDTESGEPGDGYPDNNNANDMSRVPTHRTHFSERTALGYSLTGVNARMRATHETEAGHVFIVEWEGPNDPMKPHNWSFGLRLWSTTVVGAVAFAGTAASSIDAAVLPQYAAYWGVSDVAASLATAMYLFGFAVGSQFAGPFSETFGRNLIYIVTMVVYMAFLVGCGAAPNFGAHITFRFLAGLFGATPLTVAGGTIADLFDALEKTYMFPYYAFIGFAGPLFGPVIGSFIGPSTLSWRWCEWLMLIFAGAITSVIILGQPETFAPLLLSWKAHHFRKITGDDRFRSPLEVRKTSLWSRLKIAVYRPFVMIWTEPIILLMALYLTILYIVLFTFFVGFEFIFTDVYGISQGVTNIIWVAVFVGFFPLAITLPIIYNWTVKDIRKQEAEGHINPPPIPETRLWFTMLGGAFAIPISLFWMGWTDYESVSIWSPIVASGLFGYGVITIFISAYMYVIDSYAAYAASALSFVTFSRYLAAGGMTVVGIPFYKNMNPHITLTILGAISAAMVPVPFVFYYYGARIRIRSSYAVHRVE
ncbi:hypothetical protein AAFC00_005481 [Neodothiora populina]|uniref:Major facilitator superfamily (MFS) profile domain-containing protein n=1 Tax=Neodothiora populina TaxID=2781224 RepID=A0ABR3PL05_9PEZI